MSQPPKVLLSPPDVDASDLQALVEAFEDGWIAPVGPELDQFEVELARYCGFEACVGLASGTAALQLALLGVGVEAGSEVVVQSATFAASAFAVCHAGAKPVFLDSNRSTWCMDPLLLDSFLEKRASLHNLPSAVMPVDLYGSLADYERLISVCRKYDVPIVRDAAESLGSESGGGSAQNLLPTVLSFNGNKIITTSSGGALLGSAELVEKARYLATQARSPVLHYEHEAIGYNFRLSNLLAALGRSQLGRIEQKVARRAEINAMYQEGLPTVTWCPFETTQRPNHWLSVAILPEGVEPSSLCTKLLRDHHIEARPAWKPMHQQPVFSGNEFVQGDGTSAWLFERGICLPSGSRMSDHEVERTLLALQAELSAVA